MRIEYVKPGVARDERGNFILIYGKSGGGKSATALQTAEDPIMWIIAERGQVDLTLRAINRPNIKLAVAYYEGWDDLLEFVFNIENFKKIKTVLFDSLSHVMNFHLSDEILDENYGAMDKDKIEKDLTMRVKMSVEGYGALSKQMSRLMKAFERLTVAGKDVICTARDQENPKWNRELACGPALSGKEFPRDVKGFFDFIGLIETRMDENGRVVYPPYISCDDDGSYLSKWTGIKPPNGVIRLPFNVKALLDYAHGRTKAKE